MNDRPIHSLRNLRAGSILTLLCGVVLIVWSFAEGRNHLFLIINGDLGTAADYFFRFWTNMGDGVVWIAVAVLFYRYRRKRFPLLIATLVISTLITQVTKTYVVPAEPRPTAAIKNAAIHTVPGVELHTAYSFPSGHTAAAFCFFLMACWLLDKKWVVPAGFAMALLVGYSRVYLAQHFPLDVGAGMIIALISVFLSILIQQRWDNRKMRRHKKRSVI